MSASSHYVLVGDGRVASHMRRYFAALGISFVSWSRGSEQSLVDAVELASHVLILITDQAIDPFIQANACLHSKCLVHFSGALVSPYAHTAHPLMTFPQRCYQKEFYSSIAFVVYESGPAFAELLPGLPNAHYRIPASQASYYHALCVMANNFSHMLWSKLFDEFATKFDIPQEAVQPFLDKTFANIGSQYACSLTGPFARNDYQTVHRNLRALEQDAFHGIYQAFVTALMQPLGESDGHT